MQPLEDEKMIEATKPNMKNRKFTQTQWGHLGPNKEGWKPVTPEEAKHVDEALVSARYNYEQVTGKKADPEATADYLNGARDAYVEARSKVLNPAEDNPVVVPAVAPASTTEGVVNPYGSQPVRNADGQLPLNPDGTVQIVPPVTQETVTQAVQSEGQATAPIVGQDGQEGGSEGGSEDGKLTAETYKAPRSTEDARELFAQVFGTAPAEDLKFAQLKDAIEAELGVNKEE